MSVKTSVSGFQRMTEPVRLPLERLLLQAAHVLAFFKVEVVVEAIAVDVGGHPLAGVLGGTQAQAIEAQAEYS